MRRPSLHNMQTRLALLFAGMLLAVSGVYVALLARSTNEYLAAALQRCNRGLAASVA